MVSPSNSDQKGEEHGVDGPKKVKGCKHHLVVEGLGLVLGGYVTAANTADVKAAPAVLVWVWEQFERIAKVLADQGDREVLSALITRYFAEPERQVSVEMSQRPTETKGCQVEPKRWIVERTWTWLENAQILTRVSRQT
ncbi:transposase [Phormidesmis priestleyi]|uniref:transposase n=1 Tax=Phormidesmis priestleyi TaxID=268141 RepID=UPI0011B21E5B|nr:transposase [Phormidesmis priestleyi]